MSNRKIIVGAVGVLIIGAAVTVYYLRRHREPNCREVAAHVNALWKEVGISEASGELRQRCEDERWSAVFRRELMRAETVKQVDTVVECLSADGSFNKYPAPAQCSDIWVRLNE